MNHALASVAVLALCLPAAAQSLLVQVPEQRLYGEGAPADDGPTPLYQLSTFAVAPPRPREFKTHDLVTIVVDESSRQQADQSLKSDKKVQNSATLGSVLDPWELLEARLRAGATTNLKMLDIGANNKFDGKGEYERTDKLQMKIQAEVIDVKPNGVLVLEARKYIDKNGETQETVLSGSCRREDVTQNNSVLSSQIAAMSLTTRSTGQVDDGARKGIVTKVLEGLFAF
jgi:flagellar L-ring protein precursor FlgH